MEGLQAAARQQAKGGAGGGGARGAAGGGTGGSSSSSAAAAAGAMLPRAGSSRGSSEIQPHSVSDDSGAGPGGTYTREQVLELQRRVEQYKGAYEDSEHTHQLRDQSELALKEEVAKQQVWGGEGGVGEGVWGRRAGGGGGAGILWDWRSQASVHPQGDGDGRRWGWAPPISRWAAQLHSLFPPPLSLVPPGVGPAERRRHGLLERRPSLGVRGRHNAARGADVSGGGQQGGPHKPADFSAWGSLSLGAMFQKPRNSALRATPVEPLSAPFHTFPRRCIACLPLFSPLLAHFYTFLQLRCIICPPPSSRCSAAC